MELALQAALDGDMPRLDLTPVIAVRAADRDRYSNPGHSAFRTPSSRSKDKRVIAYDCSLRGRGHVLSAR